MTKVSLRNLAAHKVRLALTVLSVVLGTAFVAGSFVFTDTLGHTFHGLFADVAKGVDVQVSDNDDKGSGVSLAELDKIKVVPGVQRIDPQISGQLVLLGSDGKQVKGGGAPSLGFAYAPPGQIIGDPYDFVTGAAPQRPDEIALNQGALKLAKLKVGDRTKVLVASSGSMDVTISGGYKTKTDTGGFIGALFTRSEATKLFTDGKHVPAVNIAGNGLPQTELRDRVAAALPGLKVKTGAQVTADTQSDVSKALSFVNIFLLAFGGIALLVGTFIIYNTFSMIVAQRLRELALLRAIGASQRQISRSVLFEATIVGLVGSLLGIAGGVGLAFGLRSLLNSFNVGLPSGPLRLELRTVIIALAVGVVVTVFSGWAPAHRAARTPPVAAMRAEFAPSGSSLRRRTRTGAVFGLFGALALIAGAAADSGGGAAGLVGIGALLLVIGVLLGAPSLSRPIVWAVGALIARPFGAVGRLARSNPARNPRRTAATAFALTLGLMLVTAIAVFGASAKKSINALVDNGVTADYIITGPDALGVPIGVGPAVGRVSGVRTATALQVIQLRLNNSSTEGTSIDGSLDDVFRYRLLQGGRAVVGHDILASRSWANDHHLTLGSTVVMSTHDGAQVSTRVTGIYADNELLGGWLGSAQLYREVTPAQNLSDIVVLVKGKPGVSLAALRTDLEQATDAYLVVKVQDREEFKGTQASQINGLLGVLYGLLALAIVIAVLGIINTLALSVVERRREIGMLRAIGMVRAQVRRTIYLESALIAAFGAIVGVVLGTTFGVLFVRTLRDQGLAHIAVPYSQALGMLIVSTVVGVLAALWPAARAARTRPLEAIAGL